MATQQPRLLGVGKFEPGPALAEGVPEAEPVARFRPVNRAQARFTTLRLDDLLDQDHPARAIWELTGRLGLEKFLTQNKCYRGSKGRDRIDPRVLVSVWVYGYSRAIGSAREVSRQMGYEPGLRWLTGDESINYHTLSDFRIQHGEAVQELFAQLLSVLDQEGLVNLDELAVDGTKIEAQASGSSFRREKTLRERLGKARQAVEVLNQQEQSEGLRGQQSAARERAIRERNQRLEAAWEELQQKQEESKAPEKVRISLTEPEARIMKDGHGRFDASYNVQTAVETSHSILVSVALTQQANDQKQLKPALERIQDQWGRLPKQVLVDGGYITQPSLAAAAQDQVEVYGPVLDIEEQQRRQAEQSLRGAGISPEFSSAAFPILGGGEQLRCPAGKRLRRLSHTAELAVYKAEAQDCAVCPHQPQCCPHSGARQIKIRKRNPLREHQQRMRTEEAQKIYRQRSKVEFPYAWIKDKLGLRKFHVRGLLKAGLEALWAATAYNFQQWARLVWKRAAAA